MLITYFDAQPGGIFYPLTFAAGNPSAATVPGVIFESGYFWLGDDFFAPRVTFESSIQINGVMDFSATDPLDEQPPEEQLFETRFYGTGLAVDATGNLTAGTITSI